MSRFIKVACIAIALFYAAAFMAERARIARELSENGPQPAHSVMPPGWPLDKPIKPVQHDI